MTRKRLWYCFEGSLLQELATSGDPTRGLRLTFGHAPEAQAYIATVLSSDLEKHSFVGPSFLHVE